MGKPSVKLGIDKIEMKSDEDIILRNDLIRLPMNATIELYVIQNELDPLMANATDMNILPLPNDLEIEELIKIVAFTRTSALFCLDSPNLKMPLSENFLKICIKKVIFC